MAAIRGLVWVGITRVPAVGGNAPVRFETGVEWDNMRPLAHRPRATGCRVSGLAWPRC